MKSVFGFWLDGDNEWIIVAKRVKCGMQIDHEHTRPLNEQYCMCDSYRQGEGAVLLCDIWRT